ncbi:MAG: recombination mediator RecR [Polyangiales bacterium]
MASDAIGELIGLLSRLPGIGERSAARLAYHVLGSSREYAHALGEALAELHSRVRRCQRCRNYTESELCKQCSDPKRDSSLLCVVARPQDAAAIERSGMFRGRYHVLHALLSPLDGVGPDALELAPLLERIAEERVNEVIVATPLSVEGEATALFLAQELKASGVRVTRIASGLPHGGELEYTDQVTLTRALDGRREL